jgi:uncharacterized protein YdeI (YjbR/CyaY-like superfamily)
MTKPTEEDFPVKSFPSTESWERWLAKNHAAKEGLWLRIFKKGSGRATVSREEALDVAICYGWIDGKGKPCDPDS